MDSRLRRIELANLRRAHACARELAARHLSDEPDSVRGWHELAKALLALGLPHPAREAVERANELTRSMPQASLLLTLGAAHAATGNAMAAIAAFEGAATLEPTSPAFVGIGWARLALGDDDGAVEAATRELPVGTIELGPAGSAARGSLFLALGRYEEATRAFMTALVFDPHHEGALAGLRDAEQVLAVFDGREPESLPNAPRTLNLVRRGRETEG